MHHEMIKPFEAARYGQGSSACVAILPPGDILQHLQVFLVVTTEGC